MLEFLPIIILCSIIGTFAIVFFTAFLALRKNNKAEIQYDRNMSDTELVKRLLGYAKPYWKEFFLVFLILLFFLHH